MPFFYFNELIDLAGKKASEDYELYKQLLTCLKDIKTKESFKALMEENKKFRNNFIVKISQLNKKYSPGISIDYEYGRFMQSIIEAQKLNFRKEQDLLTKKEDIIYYAIFKEKETKDFYENLMNMALKEDKKELEKTLKKVIEFKEKSIKQLEVLLTK